MTLTAATYFGHLKAYVNSAYVDTSRSWRKGSP